MNRIILIIMYGLIFCSTIQAQDDFKFSLKNGTEAERQTREQMRRLLKTYDLSKWIMTKTIEIDEKAIPHSHPVLTLSARHLKDDELLVSTFVHEQMHWLMTENAESTIAAKNEFRKMFPKVPVGYPEGARDEESSYLHIAVVYLEYRAVRELFGELRAKQIMDFWATDHYTWIYKTVRDRAREIGQIMFKHKLIPGLNQNTSAATEKGFIDVGANTRIFYEKVGEGADTVVIPLHFFMFEDFRHLAKDRTMIFYDVRNRGRSERVADVSTITIQEDVEDLEKLRKYFKLDKFSLIGESYTGLMVVMYAMKFPQHVEKIIQIGAVPLKFGTDYPADLTARDETPVPDKAALAEIDKLRADGFHRTNPKDFCEREWIATRPMLVGNPANASKIKSPCEHPNEWAESLERHFGAHFVSVQKLDIPKAEVAKVTHPVLTIHGTQDRNVPYGAGKEWSETFPNATLLTVKGAAHFPWVDDPETVFGGIEKFLSGEAVAEVSLPKNYFIVLYKTGESWDAAKPPNEQTWFKEHSAHLVRLRKAKRIDIGGRYSDTGMLLIRARDEAEARELITSDTAVRNKLFSVEIFPLTLFYKGSVE